PDGCSGNQELAVHRDPPSVCGDALPLCVGRRAVPANAIDRGCGGMGRDAPRRATAAYRPTKRNAAAARMQAKAPRWRQLKASPRTNTMNRPNTVNAIASCAILSWPGVQPEA